MLITNALSISRIYFLQIKNWSLWFFLYTLIFPLGLVFFVKASGNNMQPDRLAAGASILCIASIAVNATGYWIMTDRFEKRIQFLQSLPVHSISYYAGIVIVSIVQSLFNIHILIIVLGLFWGSIKYSLLIIPLTIFATSILSVMGVLIGAFVKDTSHGSLILNLLSTGTVMICPIFYPASVLPDFLAKVACFIPHTVIFHTYLHLF